MIEKGQAPLTADRTDSYCDPALVLEVSMILDRGLTTAERAKFKQVEARISTLFKAAGTVIRRCDATGEGDRRTIGLIPGLFGPPLISIPAAQFLSESD